ncbi:TetR/AcrR family transcriptional regulator [Deinococcus sp.]|uniref:TetR/AcrR family transcriptional regulator n=1 Tax=Deinococcus sp. TaxID=47478 RepID=UPI003C7C6AD3
MDDSSPPPTRKRLSQEQRRAQTRQHFLEASRTLFARQGFQGTSLDQVSELAGYSRGAFHHAFASKEDLLMALMQTCFEADLQTLQALHGAGTASQTNEFRARSDHTPVNLEAHLLKLEFWICALRLPRFGEAYAREFAAYRSALAGLIEVTAGASPLPAEFTAAVLVALSNGLDTQKLIDPAAFPATLYDQVLGQLVTREPSPERST